MMRLDEPPVAEWPKPGLPGGTVTFLMSDVVGSSALWEADHDRMDEAVRMLDTLVHDAVDGRDGIVIKPRGEGDSHFSVFRRASDAIAAAVDLQRQVTSAGWPDGFELLVRAVVHSAESDSRDGDYYGVAVNRTARLRDATHGGQVVASRTAADLSAGRLPAGVGLRSLGSHRLRDWTASHEFFQAVAPGIHSTFPPLGAAPDRPRVMAVVALDLAGSFCEAERLSDDELYGRQRQVGRLWNSAFDGRFLQTLADTCVAVFDDPAEAVRYGRTVIADGEREGFAVRGAVDAGPLIIAEAGVAGRAVLTAHRLSRRAAPGRLLASRTVAELVSRSGLEVVVAAPE